MHRATIPRFDHFPNDEVDKEPVRWPNLPGWFNASRQPTRRPAFAVADDGQVIVCADELSAANKTLAYGVGAFSPSTITHVITFKGARLT